MSAQVIQLPPRPIRPDLPKLRAALDAAKGNPSILFGAAIAGMIQARRNMKKGDRPANEKALADGLYLAFFALGEILGIPRGDVGGALPPAG